MPPMTKGTLNELLTYTPRVSKHTPEPSLRKIIHKYYLAYFDEDRASELTQRYIDAIRIEFTL